MKKRSYAASCTWGKKEAKKWVETPAGYYPGNPALEDKKQEE
jgi:hypothetical protein